MLAALPAAVRAAFELDGDSFTTALRAASEALPAEETAAVGERLRAAGLIEGREAPDTQQPPREFEPLLQGIAAAVSTESLRAEIEPVLADLEQQGWRLRLARTGRAALAAPRPGVTVALVRAGVPFPAGAPIDWATKKERKIAAWSTWAIHTV